MLFRRIRKIAQSDY